MAAAGLETMDRRLLSVIIFTCIVAGSTQGLLLPLLSYLLDLRGVTSSVNGLNAAALYVGMIGTSLFIENPIRRFGYKPVIVSGGSLVIVTLLLYPVLDSMSGWVVLRLLTGAGVTSLHFTSQLWIMSRTSPELRGRYISIYGMAYGVGFGVGPLGVSLLRFGLYVPFVSVAALFALSMLIASRVRNDRPVPPEHHGPTGKRYWITLKLALLALIPASLYAFMEAMLTSSFPIFGQRRGLTPEWVGLCLFAFVFGSLVLQVPLGIWGDRYGRKRVLMTVMGTGGLMFMFMPAAASSPYLLLGLFAVTGAMVGSISSLGMGYGVDLLPKHLLPSLSVLSTLGFGLASIVGPNMGGFLIQYVSPGSMFMGLGGILLGYTLLAQVYKPRNLEDQHVET